MTGKTSQPDLLMPSSALRAQNGLSKKIVISSWRFTAHILMIVPGPGVVYTPIAHDATEQMRKCRTTRTIWLMTSKLWSGSWGNTATGSGTFDFSAFSL